MRYRPRSVALPRTSCGVAASGSWSIAGRARSARCCDRAAGLADIDLALITHFHADHVLGLPGMLKTFALRAREAPLTIHGPAGLRALIGSLDRVIGRLPYPLSLVELEPGQTVQRDGYRIEPFATDHGVASLGYALCEDIRPGRFDMETATALGVPFGPLCGELQHGRAGDA